jgi:tetratricopeptide (TPR) repeat protein
MENEIFRNNRLIEHYIQISRYDKAIELLNQGLSQNPHDAFYHYKFGLVYYLKREYVKAENHLQSAFTYGYNSEEVQALLGKVFTELEEWIEAEACFLEALRINPMDPNINTCYADLLMKVGKRERGLELLKEAERLNPNHPEVIRYRLYEQIAKNNNNGQMIMLEKYLNNESSQVNGLLQLGFSEYYRGNYRLAKEHFREAFLQDPTNPIILNNLRLAEWNSNPLIIPLALTDKIGGLPFALLYVIIILQFVGLIDSQSFTYLIWILIGVLVYVIFAKSLVNITQKARDSNEGFWKAIIKSPHIHALLISISLALFVFYVLHLPELIVIFMLGNRFIYFGIKKWRKL